MGICSFEGSKGDMKVLRSPFAVLAHVRSGIRSSAAWEPLFQFGTVEEWLTLEAAASSIT